MRLLFFCNEFFVTTAKIFGGEVDAEGVRHGKGTTMFPNGDSYVGEYNQGKKHGQGKYTYRSQGSTLLSQHIAQLPSSHPTLSSSVTNKDWDAATKYIVDNNLQTIIPTNKKHEKKLKLESYVLTKEHIQAMLQQGPYPFYEGGYEENKRQGHGFMFYKSGDIYIGNWEQDQRHGQGLFIYKNGDVCNT